MSHQQSDTVFAGSHRVQSGVEISLLTGGFDRPYAFGLAMAMASKKVSVDVVGGAEVDSAEMHTTPGVRFLDFYGDPRLSRGLLKTAARVLGFYARMLGYAVTAKPKIFHILWNYKFPLFDRTILMLYYKAVGKKLVLTAHNVNANQRDGNDSALNRLTLRIQYQLADHIFVHTPKMKQELTEGYGVRGDAVSVIPFGINNSVPTTNLTPAEAKRRLGIGENEKAILFYGAIRPYKGLEYLVEAFQRLSVSDGSYRLIIAGEPKRDAEEYMPQLEASISGGVSDGRILAHLKFIPDEETEVYFKAADVAALPYTLIFQSGVLFLGYSFGLPAIASSVGSFSEDIIEGRTGFLCKPRDSADLARAIERYFASELYRELDHRRTDIRAHAEAGHSWDEVGAVTQGVYSQLLNQRTS